MQKLAILLVLSAVLTISSSAPAKQATADVKELLAEVEQYRTMQEELAAIEQLRRLFRNFAPSRPSTATTELATMEQTSLGEFGSMLLNTLLQNRLRSTGGPSAQQTTTVRVPSLEDILNSFRNPQEREAKVQQFDWNFDGFGDTLGSILREGGSSRNSPPFQDAADRQLVLDLIKSKLQD